MALTLFTSTSAARPTVGIYPTVGGGRSNYRAYEEWLDRAGADSVVTPSKFSGEELEKLFNGINGFLIPGGGDPFGTSADAMVDRAVKANQAGDYFPVWGTCLGFEWLTDHFAEDRTAITDGFDSEGLALPLDFTAAAADSRIYSATNASMMKWLGSEAITYNAHHEGIEPSRFATFHGLDDMMVVATGTDRKKKPFVAQVEHKTLPVYANQFHPEKIEYDTGSSVPKTPHAVAAARELASFFVSEAKKSTHTPAA